VQGYLLMQYTHQTPMGERRVERLGGGWMLGVSRNG
jgi:hypothetical protein